MTNEQVVNAWKENKAAKTKNESLSTDGEFLYSYKLMIGSTGYVSGRKTVYDYRGQISTTTSRHVGLALRVSDRVKDGEE